jgi:hypothetical protein
MVPVVNPVDKFNVADEILVVLIFDGLKVVTLKFEELKFVATIFVDV